MDIELFKNMKIDPSGYVVLRHSFGNTNLSSLCDDIYEFSNDARFYDLKPFGTIDIDTDLFLNQIVTEEDLHKVNYARVDNKYCLFIPAVRRKSGSLFTLEYYTDYWHTYIDDVTIYNPTVTRVLSKNGFYQQNTVIQRLINPSPKFSYTKIDLMTGEYTLMAHLSDEFGNQHMVVPAVVNEINTASDNYFMMLSSISRVGTVNCSCDYVYLVPKEVINSNLSKFKVTSFTLSGTTTPTFRCYEWDIINTNDIINYTITRTFAINSNKVLTIGTPYNRVELPFRYFGSITSTQTIVSCKFIFKITPFDCVVGFNYSDIYNDTTNFFKFSSIYTDAMRNLAQGRLNGQMQLLLGIINGISTFGTSIPRISGVFTVPTGEVASIPTQFPTTESNSLIPRNSLIPNNSVAPYNNEYNVYENRKLSIPYPRIYGRLSDVLNLALIGRNTNFSSHNDSYDINEALNMLGFYVWDCYDEPNIEKYNKMVGYSTSWHRLGSFNIDNFSNYRVLELNGKIYGINTEISDEMCKIFKKGVYICDNLTELKTAYEQGYV